jgi:hypothetical protein
MTHKIIVVSMYSAFRLNTVPLLQLYSAQSTSYRLFLTIKIYINLCNSFNRQRSDKCRITVLLTYFSIHCDLSESQKVQNQVTCVFDI